MEYLNSDLPGDKTPSCEYCSRQICIGTNAVAYRIGDMAKSDKGGFLHFRPDRFDDDLPVRWLHKHCTQTLFAPRGGYRPPLCDFCGETDLHREALFFELEFGMFSEKNVWEPQAANGHILRLYACWDCGWDALGEGNDTAARRMIGEG